MSDRAADLEHVLRNLIAVIQMQAEVARLQGDAASMTKALRLIEEGAEAALERVDRLGGT